MSEAPIPLPLRRGAGGSTGMRSMETRAEARSMQVRLVEHCPFPRASAAQGRRLGFTRDLSDSGMCLETDRGHRVGSLLRITVRSIDGRPTLETLARVVWERTTPAGSRMGLRLLQDAQDAAEPAQPARPRPRAVRRASHLRIA